MFQILILVAAYGVFRISREIIANRKHLTDQEIKEYKNKRRSLAESVQRRITNHIGTCDDCRKRFTGIMGE